MGMGYGFGDPTDQRTLREKRLAERNERLAAQAAGPLDGWVAAVQAVVAPSEPPKKKGGRPKGSKNKGKGDGGLA
jgi:hypothetical protein